MQMKAQFVQVGFGVIKTPPSLAGNRIYPAAAFRRIGTQVSFVDPSFQRISCCSPTAAAVAAAAPPT